ncbi:ATP-grasp domain-containing protein [Acidimicrobiia bacterium EGI L10123]|uniref:ATP-binding protein n=1 Tax=Salinilacustrithrix flava TaxID=2957203 RepID=UPI003D7C2856|nr:ATP-grasp domain-containing protein [Acidimicrobiia bacterium EGI L10123]
MATLGSGRMIFGRSRLVSDTRDFEVDQLDDLCEGLATWAAQRLELADRIVVLPLSDRLVQVISAGRRHFDERFELAVPEDAVLRGLIDKIPQLRAAERAGVNVPAWTAVEDQRDLRNVRSLRLPVIVRPTSWETKGRTDFKVRICRTAEALQELCRESLAGGARLLIQEVVGDRSDEDVEFGIVWRSADGTQTAVVTGRKRRQSHPDGGVMVWGEAVKLPDIDASARRFLDETGFTGLGGIEFIRDRDRLWFVEFNPRLEAIHFLATRAGVDTVRMAIEERGRGLVPAVEPTQQDAAAWIGTAWLARLQADPRSVPRLVRDRVAFARSPRRVRAVWAWDDPVPGLMVTGRILRSSARVLSEKLGRVVSRAERRAR